MGARDLLAQLAGLGVTVTADGDRLVIRPASKLPDSLRGLLREAKDEVLRALTDAPPRTCRQCAHRAPYGNCTEPEAAGLWDRWVLVWAPPEHAQECAAFTRCAITETRH
jgi:hypothetical protein